MSSEPDRSREIQPLTPQDLTQFQAMQAELARLLAGNFLVHGGHTGIVYSVAFSPDGALVASGSWDSSVRFWRVPDGKLLATTLLLTRGLWITYTPAGAYIPAEAKPLVMLAFERDGYRSRAEDLEPDPAGVAAALSGKPVASEPSVPPVGSIQIGAGQETREIEGASHPKGEST